MQVILLERIAKLGQMGDTVRVRDGFARNYLLPTGRALRSNDANRVRFEAQKASLIQRNEERKAEASTVAGTLNGRTFVVVRSAGETGQLYGSVSTRDVSELLRDQGFKVGRNEIQLNQPIKTIGVHAITIALHAEVDVQIKINIARSPDEAERQSRGEDLTSAAAIYGRDDDDDYADEADAEDGDETAGAAPAEVETDDAAR